MSNIIKITFYLSKLKRITKNREDGREDGRCGLVKEKSDRGATRGLILMHVEEAEQKIYKLLL